MSFLKKTIEEHKDSLQSDVTRDFIDAFLHETNKQNGQPTTFTGNVTEYEVFLCIKCLTTV